jgi:hypothetical protein
VCSHPDHSDSIRWPPTVIAIVKYPPAENLMPAYARFVAIPSAAALSSTWRPASEGSLGNVGARIGLEECWAGWGPTHSLSSGRISRASSEANRRRSAGDWRCSVSAVTSFQSFTNAILLTRLQPIDSAERDVAPRLAKPSWTDQMKTVAGFSSRRPARLG